MTQAKMTARQRRFVEEYLIDLNATQAAIRAGYSEKQAGFIGYQLLQKTPIKASIDQAIADRSEQMKLRAEDIVRMIKEDYDTCRTRVPKLDFNGDQMIGEDGKPVWKLQDAVGAKAFSDMLMKHIGGYEKDKKFEGNISIGWEDEDGD